MSLHRQIVYFTPMRGDGKYTLPYINEVIQRVQRELPTKDFVVGVEYEPETNRYGIMFTYEGF